MIRENSEKKKTKEERDEQKRREVHIYKRMRKTKSQNNKKSHTKNCASYKNKEKTQKKID